MQTLWFDLRDAVRGLRRDSAYTATVVLTLALTLGATTTAFTIVDGILLKPLAYRNADELVALHEVWHEFADRAPRLPVNERHFEYWRAHAQTFAAVAQYLWLPTNVTLRGDASQLSVARVSASLFEVLAIDALIGRTLVAADEPADQPDVAVISAALWQSRFGGQPDILGVPVVIDGTPFTVVGVLPPDFRLPAGERLISSVDVFIPLRVAVGWVGDHNNVAIGRLRSGVTIAEARAELDVLQRQVSEVASEVAGEPVTLSALVTPLADSIVGGARQGVLLLFGAVVAVLLIAASNLANLSLARTFGRMRDSAIRTALGASRRRLVRRVVLEQLVLALAGLTAGLALARISLSLFVRTAPIDLPRVTDVTLDLRVFGFALTTAVITALAVATLPAWHAASRDVQTVLRAGGTVVGTDRTGLSTRHALMTLQVTISVMLLVVTGLLGASLWRVLQIDVGFNSWRVLSIPLAFPAGGYADDRSRVDVYDRVIAGVATLPGVVAVSPASMLPLGGQGQVNFVVAEGRDAPRSEQPSANFRFVAPDYFATLELPLVAGRPFTDAERHADRPTPAVVSASMARQLWRSDDPLGRRFSRGIQGEPGFEVVGVTADARVTALEEPPPPMVYVPYWWRTRASTSLLVRTAADPATTAPAVGRLVREIDPEIAVGEARVLQDLVRAASATRRYQAEVFVASAVTALLIATLGVYAVTAYNVSRRRRELNIRVALGAETGSVLRLVTGQSARAVSAGVALGIAGSLALGGTLGSVLYDVRPREPVVLAGVALVVGLVGIAASVVAARQGVSLDLVATLRED